MLVDTDISIAVPAGTYGRVAPRSGLASKHSIDVGAGVIDADYRGPLKVLLFNFSEVDFKVEEGERVAQLIVERVSNDLLACFNRAGDLWGIAVLTLLASRFTLPRSWLWKNSKRPYAALAALARLVALAAPCLASTALELLRLIINL